LDRVDSVVPDVVMQQRRRIRQMDGYEIIRDAVARILSVIDDPEREGLRETPDRIARMYLELLQPEPFTLTYFENSAHYDQMIVEDGIPFYSLCEHHMVPFFGTAKVAYIPKNKLVGLSKLARTVDHFSRGLQTQERITDNIADFLMEQLDAYGVGVRLSAEHLCMSMRGVRKPGARTTTTALRGVFKEAPTREEFLQ
jgi:GTP cyclohydrolase I